MSWSVEEGGSPGRSGAAVYPNWKHMKRGNNRFASRTRRPIVLRPTLWAEEVSSQSCWNVYAGKILKAASQISPCDKSVLFLHLVLVLLYHFQTRSTSCEIFVEHCQNTVFVFHPHGSMFPLYSVSPPRVTHLFLQLFVEVSKLAALPLCTFQCVWSILPVSSDPLSIPVVAIFRLSWSICEVVC